jgi:hypothetical protein
MTIHHTEISCRSLRTSAALRRAAFLATASVTLATSALAQQQPLAATRTAGEPTATVRQPPASTEQAQPAAKAVQPQGWPVVTMYPSGMTITFGPLEPVAAERPSGTALPPMKSVSPPESRAPRVVLEGMPVSVTVYPSGTTTTFGAPAVVEHVAAPPVSAALPARHPVQAGSDTP